MKSDFIIPKVKGVEMAVVKRPDDEAFWDVYLINRNPAGLTNILVASRGYGSLAGRSQKTSTFRHLIEMLEPQALVKIEPIAKEVLHLTNEYWVSYYLHGEIYDKKYIFLPDSIQEKHISPISGFEMEGILHR